jgi:glycerol uptake facilitator-like aquaporin
MAALTLGLLVYLLGGISGGHFNPAVTIGMLSIGKISFKNAALYVVSQFIGAVIACVVAKYLFHSATMLVVTNGLQPAVSEALGAALFCFGVTTVVLKKVPDVMSGFVVGVSLLLGITVASTMSNGVINPAVAAGISSFSVSYAIGPVLGAIVGAFAAVYLNGQTVKYGK